MKKALGILIVALCFLVAGFFGVLFENGDVRQGSGFVFTSPNDMPEGVRHQFQLFTDTHGIFVLREVEDFTDPSEVFSSSVSVTRFSGEFNQRPFGSNIPADNPIYHDWRYEAVVQDSRGEWQTTDILQVRVGSSPTIVNYWLPRTALAGRYGIRARAFTNRIDDEGVETAEKVPASSRRAGMTGTHEVFSIFVIQYSEELNIISCEQVVDGVATGSTSYRVTDNSRSVSVGVFTNPGAIRTGELVYGEAPGEGGIFNVGNLPTDDPDESLLVSNLRLQWVIEDAWGRPLHEDAIRPDIEVVDGMLRVTVQCDALGFLVAPRTNYVVRVFHDIDDTVFGTFVIDNGGRFQNPGSNAGGGIVMLVLGIVFVLGFVGMFVAPRVVARMQQVQYDANERKRFKRQVTKEDLTAEYKGSSKRVMDKKDHDKLTDAEKEELFKQRAETARETKGGKFLGKMAENRAKRDFAREQGLTMDEYNELEKKARQMEASKEASLAAFRKAVEEKTGVYTKQQEIEEEMERKKREKAAMQKKRNEGEPEFDLLESERGKEDVPEVYKEKEEAKVAEAAEEENKGSILQRLKRLTGEED